MGTLPSPMISWSTIVIPIRRSKNSVSERCRTYRRTESVCEFSQRVENENFD